MISQIVRSYVRTNYSAWNEAGVSDEPCPTLFHARHKRKEKERNKIVFFVSFGSRFFVCLSKIYPPAAVYIVMMLCVANPLRDCCFVRSGPAALNSIFRAWRLFSSLAPCLLSIAALFFSLFQPTDMSSSSVDKDENLIVVPCTAGRRRRPEGPSPTEDRVTRERENYLCFRQQLLLLMFTLRPERKNRLVFCVYCYYNLSSSSSSSSFKRMKWLEYWK